MTANGMLYAIATAGVAGVLLIALGTRTRWLQSVDDRIEAGVEPHRARWRRAAGIATLTGEKFVHPVIAALSALALIHYRPGHPHRFLIPLGAASLGGIVFHHAVKFIYHRPRPEGALRRNKTEGAYPSGHTTNATSVVVASAFLLVQEGLVTIGIIVPVVVALCLATGASRVVLGWHWTTDVLGGWCAGACVSSLAAALYLAMR